MNHVAGQHDKDDYPEYGAEEAGRDIARHPRPQWLRARWRSTQCLTLRPANGTLILPLWSGGRGITAVRFWPLSDLWRSLKPVSLMAQIKEH